MNKGSSDGIASNVQERACGRWEYLCRRLYSSVFYKKLYRKLNPNHPHFTPKAIRVLESRLHKDMKLFEWGSGVSTLWFAERVSQVVSIEHDPFWHEQVTGGLLSLRAKNSKCILIPPVNDETLRSYKWQSNWKYYDVLGRPPRKPEFLEYISAIDDYDDLSFDCIAIDGRERIGCLVHAIPKLRKGGILILDDSMRPRYAEAFDLLQEWPTEQFDFGLLQTTIFTKPNK